MTAFLGAIREYVPGTNVTITDLGYGVARIDASGGGAQGPQGAQGAQGAAGTGGMTVVHITNADSPYTPAGDEIVLADATAGITVVLPPLTVDSVTTVKRINAAGSNVTVDPGAANLDGSNGAYVLGAQWDAASVAADGTDLFLTSVYP